MTELALRPDPATATPAPISAPDSLLQWAQAANAAQQLATPLCRTDFVPQQFRGNVAAATAAILYGAEAGLSPLQALQGVYVISGKPAMYARTLLAVAQGAGHEVWTEELTDHRAIVCGRRRGSSNVERAVWTLDRAKKAGYTKNQKYSSDPQSMLLARAQADICRRIAADALLGMAYSVEELQDDEPSAGPSVNRTTSNGGPRTARRAPAPPPAEPDLEQPRQIAKPPADSQTAEKPAAQPAAEPSQPGPATVPITPQQSKKLHAAMNEAGMTDRDLRLAFCVDQIGRDITTSSDLTKAEASRVLDALAELADSDQDEPEPPEPEL